MSLQAFQRAAVDRIFDALTTETGPRRYLLADEVGLGKTHIARGVVARFEEAAPSPLTAVYVCSNQAIAAQNATKLAGDGGVEPATRRLTLLSTKGVLKENKEEGHRLLSFTPGTSLKLGGATGIQYERKLLLHLLDRLAATPEGAGRNRWAHFFRASCGDYFVGEVARAKLARLFPDSADCFPQAFIDRLEEFWSSRRVRPTRSSYGAAARWRSASAPSRARRASRCVSSRPIPRTFSVRPA